MSCARFPQASGWGTVQGLVASGESCIAHGLVNLGAEWILLEGQLATQTTWPQIVAALLAHQDGVEEGRDGNPTVCCM